MRCGVSEHSFLHNKYASDVNIHPRRAGFCLFNARVRRFDRLYRARGSVIRAIDRRAGLRTYRDHR